MNAGVQRMQKIYEGQLFIITNKAFASFHARPCRSVPFRCYDEKYYFRCLIWLEILLFYLEKRVCTQ